MQMPHLHTVQMGHRYKLASIIFLLLVVLGRFFLLPNEGTQHNNNASDDSQNTKADHPFQSIFRYEYTESRNNMVRTCCCGICHRGIHTHDIENKKANESQAGKARSDDSLSLTINPIYYSVLATTT